MPKRKRDEDAALGCIVFAVLCLLFMPVVGLFLLSRKDPEKKTWGLILLIAGIILWIIVLVGRS